MINSPLKERYDLLHKNMNEISNHIQFSEKKLIKVSPLEFSINRIYAVTIISSSFRI